MTRVHVAKKLLEHGPLTFGEFCEITRWKASQAWTALSNLEKSGYLQCTGPRMKRQYMLVSPTRTA